MAKNNEITHTGKIVEITPEFTTVEIVVSSACSTCHAKGLCGMSEEKDKIVTLPTDPYATYNVGDQVQVCTKMSMGLKAAWISYVIPLVVLMILMLSLSALFESSPNKSLIAGLGSIGGVAVYYFIIWLMRDRLNDEFIFYIK